VSDIQTGSRFEIHSSRIWALLHFKVTSVVFPLHMYADRHGISTVKVAFWLTPWIRSEEHLPMSHVAEIGHDRGFIWDTISIESSGGLNPLTILGLPKGRARDFVQHVRAIMGS
jgi:hypothetical protein